MQWLTPWTVIGAVLCVLALVILFFPFVFKIDFEAGLKGLDARLFIFKKQLYKYEKKFSKEKETDSLRETEDFDNRPDNEEAVTPTYVPPKKKVEPDTEPATKTAEKPKEEPATGPVIKSDDNAPEKLEPQESKANLVEKDVVARAPEPAKEKQEAPKVEKAVSPEKEKKESQEKPKKRSLTDTEFWTILLTPEFDERAWWAIRKWLFCLLCLFHVRFKDCFVEGIQSDVMTMGYGAALNGIIKGYPYIGDWDIRMDWTRDHELRAAGQILASVNICRIIGLLLATLFYGGIIAFKFWRRRSRVLKTNELPELGWIRMKIVKLMAEE